MKAALRTVDDHGHIWQGLTFWCPGCEVLVDGEAQRGLHMLPVSGDSNGKPMWSWNGDLESVTLEPSILTRTTWAGVEHICHSFLRNGVFEFLGDCTHTLVGQRVPLPDLPNWAARE